MSTRGHQSDEVPKVIKLKIIMDKTRDQVIFAESDHEFIDTLFSFLTLPLGTILRLLEKDMVQLGSISRVYASVYSIDPKFLRTSHCKSMLLMPRNTSEAHCGKLKLNVDHSENAGKLFGNYHCRKFVSFLQNMRCFHCGSLMKFPTRVFEKEEKGSCVGESAVEVFLKGGAASFMITDDFQVMPASTASYIDLFEKLEVSHRNGIEAVTMEVGIKEVLQLLKFSLLSTTPLTNLVLSSKENWVRDTSKFKDGPTAKSDKKAIPQNLNSMSMKLIVSKSKKKVLYAEAGVELIDLLFSFLTFPLGAVVKLLGCNSKLNCIDNLYKGADDLSSRNYIKSEECKNRLLSPKLYPHYHYKSHILQLEEESPEIRVDEETAFDGETVALILDPKSPTGKTVNGEGYLKGPATFMIMDNLLVSPFSPTSSIALLKQLKVPTSDLEERNVIVGKNEALNLLKASLISKTVLNDVFNRREPSPEVMLKV